MVCHIWITESFLFAILSSALNSVICWKCFWFEENTCCQIIALYESKVWQYFEIKKNVTEDWTPRNCLYFKSEQSKHMVKMNLFRKIMHRHKIKCKLCAPVSASCVAPLHVVAGGYVRSATQKGDHHYQLRNPFPIAQLIRHDGLVPWLPGLQQQESALNW